MPDFLILGHELIHADRNRRGVRFPSRQTAYVQINLSRRRFLRFLWWIYERYTGSEPTSLEEIATIGLLNGRHNDDCDITENDLRQEHGLNPRTAHFAMPGWDYN